MNRNIVIRFVLILGLALIVLSAAATMNAGVAVKGTIGAGEQVTQKVAGVNQSLEDARISSAIKMKYANDDLVSGSKINVDTDHRIVTLKGALKNQAELDRAIELGRSVDGVKSVHSLLTVSPKNK